MKQILFLSLLALSFAAHAEPKETTITQQCKLGEVAVLERPTMKGDGSFTVRSSCVPASCYVSLPEKNVYTVTLSSQGLIESTMASAQIVALIPAASKAELKAATQKLVQRGVCNKVYIRSVWDDL